MPLGSDRGISQPIGSPTLENQVMSLSEQVDTLTIENARLRNYADEVEAAWTDLLQAFEIQQSASIKVVSSAQHMQRAAQSRNAHLTPND